MPESKPQFSYGRVNKATTSQDPNPQLTIGSLNKATFSQANKATFSQVNEATFSQDPNPQLTLGRVNKACSEDVLATSSPSSPLTDSWRWALDVGEPMLSSPSPSFFSLFCCLRRSRHWLCSPSIKAEGWSLDRAGVTASTYLWQRIYI